MIDKTWPVKIRYGKNNCQQKFMAVSDRPLKVLRQVAEGPMLDVKTLNNFVLISKN